MLNLQTFSIPFWLSLIFCFKALSLEAQPGYVSYIVTGNKLIVYTTESVYSFAPYGDEMLRLGFHFGQDTTYPVSQSVVMDPLGISTVADSGDYLLYTTAGFDVWIQKEPLYFTVMSHGNAILWNGSAWAEGQGSGMLFRTEPDAAWYGGGSRAIPMNRAGLDLYMLNEPFYGYGWGADRLNISMPMAVSSEGFALYFESPVPGNLSLGSYQPGLIRYDASEGPLSCFVIRTADPDSLMKPYTQLTGRQPLPPLWALGYIQSRFGYENAAEAYDVVDKMVAEGFPIDAIIFDLQWQGGVGVMGNLDWDLSRFPNPQGMMQDFLEKGVKSVCIFDPYFTKLCQYYPMLAGIGWLAKNQGGQPYVIQDFWAGEAGLIDVTIPAVKEWFWQRCKQQIEMGVTGLWTDLGEPEKAPEDMVFLAGSSLQIRQTYNLRWSEFIYSRYRRDYPDRRLFNLTRSGYAGMQRYSAFPWSGDVQKSYGGLRAQVPIMLGMGLCGIGYMHADIGGFAGQYNPELYTRWQQMGAFIPVMRAHGTGVVTEPVYYPEPYKSIVRDFIRLRYRLLPYHYTLAWENSLTGMPLARPLFFADPQLKDVDDQYLWGNDLMVAPVMEESANSRQVVFPQGKWIDFARWSVHHGGNTAEIFAPLNYLPLYARAGALIPLLPDIQHTGEYDGGSYQVRYFADPDISSSSARVYMDDGETWLASTDNQYCLLHLDALYQGGNADINLLRTGEGFTGEKLTKEIVLEIPRVNEWPDDVAYNGVELTVTGDIAVFQSLPMAALWLEDEYMLLIRVNWESEMAGLIRIEGLSLSGSFSVREKNLQQVTFYPNPLKTDGLFSVSIPSGGNYYFQLFNSLGQLTGYHSMNYDSGGIYRHSWTTFFSADLPVGVYMINIFGPNGIRDSKKIIVVTY